MTALDYLEGELRSLSEAGLLREPETANQREEFLRAAEAAETTALDLTSNDYLGLGQERVSRETLAAVDGRPVGAGASRLVHGTRSDHDLLESAIANWTRQPSALLFSSGYAANVGLLSALAQPGDLIVSDALNHASIIDGCRLSRATVQVVPHLDPDACHRALDRPARRRWLVTESYFSMDGDTPDLAALRSIADAYDAALIVDEAHALGVFGPRGGGLCAAQGVQPDILVGTFGKAFGLHGAFAAGPSLLRTYLWNRARSFVFSTATLPLHAALAHSHLKTLQAADSARAHLLTLSTLLRQRLAEGNLRLPAASHGPIIPLLLGEPTVALDAAKRLQTAGILVQPIRPPTVPPSTSRLRLTVTARHTQSDINRVADALLDLCSP